MGKEEIGKYGVTGVPALIINGEVKSVGSVPARAKLIEWLKGAGRKQRDEGRRTMDEKKNNER